MADVILFRPRCEPPEEELHIDLLTAVDAAIRDLREISQQCGEEASRKADECRRMLEGAYEAALCSC